MVKIVFAVAAALALAVGPASIRAADPGAQSTSVLQQRIADAAPGDLVIVEGGTYEGLLTIDKPVTLIGRNWPVIDGGGEGDVVRITADDAGISGFVVQGSSKSLSKEPAAIKISEVDRVTVRRNIIRDAYLGIHVTASKQSLIEKNQIEGDPSIPNGRRGHGVYMWRAEQTAVHGNVIEHAADAIHLEFSERNGIGSNEASNSRYALHFMYSHGNKVVGNKFHDNLAGAVLMFSNDTLLHNNELSSNRKGATGTGILLKDVNNIFAEENRVLRNKYGLLAEGSPQMAGATAIFQRNVFALNDNGVAVHSSAPITFVQNAMIDNTVQIKALSGSLTNRALSSHGGTTEAHASAREREQARLPENAQWSSNGLGNYWSDYRGYDANGDGVGDQPYLPRPAFAGRLADDDSLRLFQFTPAQQAIDIAADMFPIYKYDAVIEDGSPLMKPPEGLALPQRGEVDVVLLAVSLGLVSLATWGMLALSGYGRRLALVASLKKRRPTLRGGGAAA